MGRAEVTKAFDILTNELRQVRLALHQERETAIRNDDVQSEDHLQELDTKVLEIGRAVRALSDGWDVYLSWDGTPPPDAEPPAAPRAEAERRPSLPFRPDDSPRFSFRADTDATLQRLIRTGVISAPMEIFKRYKGEEVRATIEKDGTITCFGKTFTSLSYAAIEVVMRLNPDRENPEENGWRFWQFLDPHTHTYRQMDVLRH